jgi:hypothetical protein
MMLVERVDRFDPVHARHENVANDQIECTRFDRRNPGTAICRNRYVVAVLFKHHLDGTAHRGVVVHHLAWLMRVLPQTANQHFIL